jgi:hypothetical protein
MTRRRTLRRPETCDYLHSHGELLFIANLQTAKILDEFVIQVEMNIREFRQLARLETVGQARRTWVSPFSCVTRKVAVTFLRSVIGSR